jgi:hypothetical protein
MTFCANTVCLTPHRLSLSPYLSSLASSLALHSFLRNRLLPNCLASAHLRLLLLHQLVFASHPYQSPSETTYFSFSYRTPPLQSSVAMSIDQDQLDFMGASLEGTHIPILGECAYLFASVALPFTPQGHPVSLRLSFSISSAIADQTLPTDDLIDTVFEDLIPSAGEDDMEQYFFTVSPLDDCFVWCRYDAVLQVLVN